MAPEHDHHDHDHHHHQPASYAEAVAMYRAQKDEYFRASPHSPLPAAERDAFEGIPYFDVDPALRFDGLVLEPYAGTEPTAFQIPTSDGKLRAAERAGTFSFDVDGKACRLTAYVFEGGDARSVFVPFLDGTSGTETYGAGRYLDLERDDDDTYSIDFNLAYHPSCVFDARFSCPVTPAENRLAVRIEAGERLPTASA
jgi:uncharacterized protein